MAYSLFEVTIGQIINLCSMINREGKEAQLCNLTRRNLIRRVMQFPLEFCAVPNGIAPLTFGGNF